MDGKDLANILASEVAQLVIGRLCDSGEGIERIIVAMEAFDSDFADIDRLRQAQVRLIDTLDAFTEAFAGDDLGGLYAEVQQVLADGRKRILNRD